MNERKTYRELFAAYVSGRLSADDRARMDRALASDPALARELELLAPVAEVLERELSGPVDFRLSADRLAVIRAAASKHIVSFPVERTSASSRAASVYLRRWVPAIAAGVAVVIGAIAGFSTGRENFDGRSVPSQVALSAGSPSAAVDADDVYYYRPNYSVDRYTSLLARGRPRSAELATFGLPGPPSPYLLRGEQLLLQ